MENIAYKEFHDKILKALAETIEKKFLECLGQGTYGWACENRRGLYDEVKGIEAEIDSLWREEADFKVFKDKVLAWGKGMLRMFEEHRKWLRENPPTNAHQGDHKGAPLQEPVQEKLL